METSIVITQHVINTINSLPMEERLAITAALAGEMILGADSSKALTPTQEMIFAMIKSYVKRDTERAFGENGAFAQATLTMRTCPISQSAYAF